MKKYNGAFVLVPELIIYRKGLWLIISTVTYNAVMRRKQNVKTTVYCWREYCSVICWVPYPHHCHDVTLSYPLRNEHMTTFHFSVQDVMCGNNINDFCKCLQIPHGPWSFVCGQDQVTTSWFIKVLAASVAGVIWGTCIVYLSVTWFLKGDVWCELDEMSIELSQWRRSAVDISLAWYCISVSS